MRISIDATHTLEGNIRWKRDEARVLQAKLEVLGKREGRPLTDGDILVNKIRQSLVAKGNRHPAHVINIDALRYIRVHMVVSERSKYVTNLLVEKSY